MVEPALTTARDEILARIRAVDRSPPEPIDRRYRRSGSLSRTELVELFAARVADYRADVRLVTAGGVADAIAASCHPRDAVRVAIPTDLPAVWRTTELELVEDRGLSARELDAVDGVVTGCTAAIAETGTIILSGGESEGRRALSLVPDLHICVVRSDQIVELVPEALAVLDPRRPLTFISGPSATSDIELSRVEGVHGPRTLVVLIVNEEDP
jgi:L-lactate dehydrogenase complex protein LldG